MAKGNLLKSMFGLGSNSSKNPRKSEENPKNQILNKFDSSLLKDSVANVTFKGLECVKQFLQQISEYYQDLLVQINNTEYLNEQETMILSKALKDFYKGSDNKQKETYIEMSSQIYALISVEHLNLNTNKTTSLSNKIDNYLNTINNDILCNYKRDISSTLKQISSLKKNLSNASGNKKNTHKDKDSNHSLSNTETSSQPINEELRVLEDKLEDQINEMELILIEMSTRQRTVAELLLDDIMYTRKFHSDCQNIVGSKLYDVEDCIYENNKQQILGISLRDLKECFKQELSVFFTRAFRFLIDNGVLHTKNIFVENSENDDKIYTLREFLLSGVLDMSLFKNNLNVIGSGILMYLRELPVPLIHIDDKIDWHTESLRRSYVKRAHQLVSIINELACIRRTNLLYLLAFLHFIIKYSTDNSINSIEISKIFVPCLFSAEYLSTVDQEPIAIIMSDILTYYNKFFPIEYKRFNFGVHFVSKQPPSSKSSSLSEHDENRPTISINNDTFTSRLSAILLSNEANTIDKNQLTLSKSRSFTKKNSSNDKDASNLKTNMSQKKSNRNEFNLPKNNFIEEIKNASKLSPQKNPVIINSVYNEDKPLDSPAIVHQESNKIDNTSHIKPICCSILDDGSCESSELSRKSSSRRKLSLSFSKTTEDSASPTARSGRGYSVSFVIQKYNMLSKKNGRSKKIKDDSSCIKKNKKPSLPPKPSRSMLLPKTNAVPSLSHDIKNSSHSSDELCDFLSIRDRIKKLENFMDKAS